ncbi:MAG: hypothetical protein GX417_08715 [Clostridiales bacterium]|nr:hypothetical protein [Clostridiales bacterium]
MMKTTRMLKAALIFCSLLVFAAPAQAEESPAYGDLTGDGMIGAADAAALLRGVAFGRLSEQTRPDLDFTKNGQIDKTDARAALLYACGGIEDIIAFGERVASGLCDERLFDRFSYTGIQNDRLGNYRSENVAVTISSGRSGTSNYHLADIYLQDITSFITAFGGGAFGGGTETVRSMFESVPDAVVALNGDFYSLHIYGPVIRNGVTYEGHVSNAWDIGVLLTSGELLTCPYRTLTKEALAEMDAYQTWVFGPALLDEQGHAKTSFRSWVTPTNPRSVLGYYEPGHYAFLTVDGRSSESKGMTMQQLSQLCEDLGFARAYNLDGGQSSVLMAQNGAINDPYRGGRATSDILVIRDLQPG